MIFHVIWRPLAETQLTAEWIRAQNKDAVAGYVEQIDRILARNPLEQGESREGNFRLWFHRPLSVLFEVDDGRKTIFVWAIKWSGK